MACSDSALVRAVRAAPLADIETVATKAAAGDVAVAVALLRTGGRGRCDSAAARAFVRAGGHTGEDPPAQRSALLQSGSCSPAVKRVAAMYLTAHGGENAVGFGGLDRTRWAQVWSDPPGVFGDSV